MNVDFDKRYKEILKAPHSEYSSVLEDVLLVCNKLEEKGVLYSLKDQIGSSIHVSPISTKTQLTLRFFDACKDEITTLEVGLTKDHTLLPQDFLRIAKRLEMACNHVTTFGLEEIAQYAAAYCREEQDIALDDNVKDDCLVEDPPKETTGF